MTGANHGIGAAIAIELARLGADVFATYLRSAEAPGAGGRPPAYAVARSADGVAVTSAVEALGRRCVAVEADLSDPGVPARLLDQAEAELGPVSLLVNNASGWRKDTFSGAADRYGRNNEPVTAASIDAQFAVDVRAAALLISEFATRARARGATWGRIVGLTSGGPMGFPGEVSYGAAKAAQENFTMSASIELAALGITANVVYPPVTDTGWVTEDVRRFVAETDDHVHVATAEQVATVVGWLCTPAADLVTGNVIRLR